MNVENKIRKRINTFIALTGQYPDKITITEKEWNELNNIDHIDRVRLIVKK